MALVAEAPVNPYPYPVSVIYLPRHSQDLAWPHSPRCSSDTAARALLQGFIPGVWGVSHGALQFMAYEQMKTAYNVRRGQAIDAKLVSAPTLKTREGSF